MSHHFSVISRETIKDEYGGLIEVSILRDNSTGVNYLLTNDYRGAGGAGGLTPLLDSNGNIVVS